MLWYEYSLYRVSSVTVSELSTFGQRSGNFRITDGVADYANAVGFRTGDSTCVPIRSRANPNGPVSVVMLLSAYEPASELKKHPWSIELVGQIDEMPAGLP